MSTEFAHKISESTLLEKNDFGLKKFALCANAKKEEDNMKNKETFIFALLLLLLLLSIGFVKCVKAITYEWPDFFRSRSKLENNVVWASFLN
jgi:hypothetical protein